MQSAYGVLSPNWTMISIPKPRLWEHHGEGAGRIGRKRWRMGSSEMLSLEHGMDVAPTMSQCSSSAAQGQVNKISLPTGSNNWA